jgi:hypothetical protein
VGVSPEGTLRWALNESLRLMASAALVNMGGFLDRFALPLAVIMAVMYLASINDEIINLEVRKRMVVDL